jgi:hypothetical protein
MTAVRDTIVMSVEPETECPRGGIGHSRRDCDRLIDFWRANLVGRGAPALDLTAIDTDEWSHRFLITIDPKLEGSALLAYGEELARLLEIPAEHRAHVPMRRLVPPRYESIFLRGCAGVQRRNAPVRIEGVLARDGDRCELFRASFIPIDNRAEKKVGLAVGTLNSRLA